MQNRNMSGLPFGNHTQNEGVSVIFRNCVINDVDAIVCGFFYVSYDVGVVVLCSHSLGSVEGEVRGYWQFAHIEDEVGSEALDELVVTLGSGSDNLVSRELCQLDRVLSNRRASTINKELGVGHERVTSIGSQIFYSPRFQARVDLRHRVEGA